LSSGRGLARPGDLGRDNVLLTYDVASGISSDPIVSGDFAGETLAVSPSGCYAAFTSEYRDQPRLHVWGLVQAGDDLLRQDLRQRAEALALDPSGRALAIAAGGRIATYRVSGITTSDCEIYSRKPSQAAGPKVTVGSETSPLIATGGTKPVVAVLRFETTANVSADLGDGVSEMVSGELANSQAVVVVERSAIESVLKEMSIQRSGLTDADAVKIGKGLNARKVVFGSVRRFGEDTFLLTVRVVDVETQRNEGQREVTCEGCREQHVLNAARELRRLLVR
jgi:TolB-like protein